MPAQISHILLGLDALPALPEDWRRSLDLPAFRLGCQGPDVFYHNRRTKPGAFLYGTRLHRRGWGSFLARFRREALDRGWGPGHPGMSFLIGMAGHGFLDRRGHPFIVAHSGWRRPRDASTEVLRHSHAFLERILDRELWRTRSGRPWAECFWQDEVAGPGHFGAEFWAAWAEALHEVFPQLSARADVELRLKNAVADTKGFLEFTAPSRRDQALRAARAGAIHWFHPEHLPDWDFLNEARAPWPDPLTGADRTESFGDLFDRAATDTRALLATLEDRTADWETLVGNGSLNLPGEAGESRGPEHCRPWDYGELYDREVRGRLAARAD